MIENHLQLPGVGPSSIRTIHWVTHPPQLLEASHHVHILEMRGDSDQRLMNDDVLCLFLLTIEHPSDPNDYSERFKVLWTPKVASRERILLHLRAADICRERTCHLHINHVIWRESDSIIKHFKDGDFVHLRVVVNPGSSVIATRCDIQGYEITERQRRVFTNSTSSEETEVRTPQSTQGRSRSRSREVSFEDSEEELPRPRPSQAPDLEESDQDSLLQISGAKLRTSLTLDEMIPRPAVVECDFTPVRDADDLLQGLPWILTNFDDLAVGDPFLEALIPYLLPWQGEDPVAYHLYTDGSFFKKSPNLGGCGVLLMVTTHHGQLCGGALSRTCLPTAKSHSAEAIAMLWATLIAVQLSNHHRVYHPNMPFALEFCFDAQVTGQQCAGLWTSFRHPQIQRLSRDLIYILQFRHGFEAISWTHIRAHQGHCWNEVVDHLAKSAIDQTDMRQSSDLLYAIIEHDGTLNAFDWIWAIELMDASHPSMPQLFDNHMYHFRHPIKDSTTFTQHFGNQSPIETMEVPQRRNVKMKVATFNVLTLDAKRNKEIGNGTSGRQLSLMQQCSQQGLHIIGVQETRTARITGQNNPHYHIISSPCRSDGHYGVQIWIHRRLLIDEEERSFQSNDFRIIWSAPNTLAVRLAHPSIHCLIIAARGPTTDKPVEDIQAYWDLISQKVLDKFPGWKIILLCDSNAHVGSCPSTSISTNGAEPENVAGEIFHIHGLCDMTFGCLLLGRGFTKVSTTPTSLRMDNTDIV